MTKNKSFTPLHSFGGTDGNSLNRRVDPMSLKDTAAQLAWLVAGMGLIVVVVRVVR